MALNPKTMLRIELKANTRAFRIARQLAQRINHLAPKDPEHFAHTPGPPLSKSYFVRSSEAGGYIIASRQPYWRYVEFGTLEHGDAQPHVRVALDEARARIR